MSKENLKWKRKKTLESTKKDLVDRQAFLCEKRDMLDNELKKLRQDKYAAIKKKDQDTVNLIEDMIKDVENDLNKVNTEYKANGETLGQYERALTDKGNMKSGILGTLFMGVGTGAAIWLGRDSLNKAYRANEEGLLVNKGPLDFFRNLNPLKLINNQKLFK